MPRLQRSDWLTVPNGITTFRLAIIAVFLWVALDRHDDNVAIVVLAVGGVSDFADGFLARRLHQETTLGRFLDPAVDRIYIIAVFLALGFRDVFPWWLVAAPILRDLALAAMVPWLRAHGLLTLPVHYLGKCATFVLLYAFPVLLLGDLDGLPGTLAKVIGWASAIWGVALYWWSGILYAVQTWRIVSTQPRRSAPPLLRSRAR